MDKYLKYVVLSDAQLAAIGESHTEYLSSWSQQFDRDIAVFNAKWNAPFADSQNHDAPNIAEAFRDAVEEGDRLKFKLRSANDAFWDEISTLLAEQQAVAFQRVRLAHDRFSYRRGRQGGLRERDVDPIELVEHLQLDELDRQRLDALLLDYEPVYVDALRIAAASDQRRMALQFEVYEVLRTLPPGEAPDGETQGVLNRLEERAGKVAYGAERRLVDAVKRVLRQMLNTLSSEAAAELQRLFNEYSYPEVYPDPTFAGEIYDAAASLPTLDEIRRVALKAVHEEYVASNSQLSEKMAKTLFDISVIGFRAEAAAGPRTADKEDTYRKLSEKRERLDLAQPARVRALLFPEESAQLAPWKYEKAIAPQRWDPRDPALRAPLISPTTQPTAR